MTNSQEIELEFEEDIVFLSRIDGELIVEEQDDAPYLEFID